MGIPNRLPFEFSCTCGARIAVDPMTKERKIPCPRCQKPLDFTVDFDTKKRTMRVSRVAPKGTEKSEAGAPVETAPSEPPKGRASGRTVRGVFAKCSCGTSFPVDEGQLSEIQTCPGCQCVYHVVVKMEAKKKVAILVPQKPLVHRDEIIRATIYRKAPGAKAGTDPAPAPSEGKDFARKSHTRIVVPKDPSPPDEPARPEPAPEIPPGAQAVPCPCGETFLVRKSDLAGGLTCVRCGLAAGFEEVRDPQTLAPTLRIKARSGG